jgi:branched-chain amino acid transport system ATP-binding protein
LDVVGIAKLASRISGALSFGEQKLVSLAGCVGAGARIWMLDEPVSGLGLIARDAVLKVLRDARDRGVLLVVIEHDLAAVKAVADEVVVMAGGSIKMRGAAATVLSSSELLGLYVGRT